MSSMNNFIVERLKYYKCWELQSASDLARSGPSSKPNTEEPELIEIVEWTGKINLL